LNDKKYIIMGCGCNSNNNNAPKKDQSYTKKVVEKRSPPRVHSQKGFVTPPVPAESKSPSLLRKALNLGEAVANHVADGMSKVSKEDIGKRLGVCQRCPFRSNGECTKCGCVLSVKAAWKTSECPDNRWPQLTEQK
tara:strand:- start:451 stop:858 length:408 start_codon:yes stop_codon:yes gene_type:complete